MKLAVLFSGGKDSTLALHKASKLHEIVCLISLISKNPASYMWHVPNIHLVAAQAKALNLSVLTKVTAGKKEKELKDFKELLKVAKHRHNIQGLVTGTIKSIYQTSRIQKICHELDLWCFNPLWLKDEITLLNEIADKFEVIISGVFAYPIEEELLGKKIDRKMIGKLSTLQKIYKINPSGEGGELETTVLNAPLYKQRIQILKSNIKYENYSGIFKIKKFKLVKK